MIRDAFLSAAAQARALIATRAVVDAWDQPSTLREMTVGDLAGHLARGVFTVDQYLSAPVPAGTKPVTAHAYFNSVTLGPDIDNELNTQIRARSRAESTDGHAALLARLDGMIRTLTDALAHEPSDRVVAVIGSAAMLLDEYLVARLVEIGVHLDDLAVSIAVPTPELDNEGRNAVLDCLFATARGRHGDLAVMRALARRERASDDVLRVF